MLSSCYAYDGPTRSKIAHNLEPAPQKIIGKFTKSEYVAKVANEVQEKIKEAEVKLLNDSLTLMFPNHITYNFSNLIPEKSIDIQMDKLAELLRKYKLVDILVTGHTDSRGEFKVNQTISQVRADIIRDMLYVRKIDSKRLSSWGLADNSPIASNSIASGRAKNRRVEFVVLYSTM